MNAAASPQKIDETKGSGRAYQAESQLDKTFCPIGFKDVLGLLISHGSGDVVCDYIRLSDCEARIWI
jgi:hypothetical protein